MTPPAAVVVLAAGQGTRMRSSLPKVLHEVAGRTLLQHVRAATDALCPELRLVVVGHGADQVKASLGAGADAAVDERAVLQAEQRGTGHAVRIALDALPSSATGSVVVVPGDVPLLSPATLQGLLDRHDATSAAVTMLTATVEDPTGYGRIVRDADGHPLGIVEERDADETTRAIHEVGTSVYAFDLGFLREAVAELAEDNAAGEQYLTDVVGIAAAREQVVVAVSVDDPNEVAGVNDRVQLGVVTRLMRDRIVRAHQLAGVTVVDPESTWIDAEVRIAADTTIEPGCQLLGNTTVAAGAVIGPDSTLANTTVGQEARVLRAHCDGAEIGDRVSVGPFAFLRPGTRLLPGAKIGTFVEVKNSQVGEESRVPHLTYVGDATVGRESNIGASSVFVNYDGVNKHRSTIGDHVRTGSDNTFVAPVSVGDGAYTGAGTVVREDVPPGALAVSAGQQRNIDGWVARKRAGTPAAAAAQRALDGRQSGDASGERRTDDEQGVQQ